MSLWMRRHIRTSGDVAFVFCAAANLKLADEISAKNKAL